MIDSSPSAPTSHRRWLSLLITGVLAISCTQQSPDANAPGSQDAPAEASSRPHIVTTSRTVDWLVRRLVANDADVRLLLPHDADADTWRPPAEAIAELLDVDLIVAHHPDYERWMATASLPLSTVVYAGSELDLLARPARRHSHGAEGEHSHDEIEPRMWLDPLAVLEQAREVHRLLGARLALDAGALDQRLDDLRVDLEALDSDLESALEPIAGGSVFSVIGDRLAIEYLARRYDFDVVAREDAASRSIPHFRLAEPWRTDHQATPQDEPTIDLLLLDRHPSPDAVDDAYDYLALAQGNIDQLRRALPRELE